MVVLAVGVLPALEFHKTQFLKAQTTDSQHLSGFNIIGTLNRTMTIFLFTWVTEKFLDDQ